MRRKTKVINIGNVAIGGSNPIRVQSMIKVDTRNVPLAVSEIIRLEDAGCEIVRLAVKDFEAASALSKIKQNVHIPIVADIHFDPQLALASIENGADKIRLNPSNIEDKEWIKRIASSAKARNIPIRVGANLGSFKERPENTVQALVESAVKEVKILEDEGFDKIVVSIKSSDVITTIKANMKISELLDYPIHIGITEAGPLEESLVKSSIGIGFLILNGIGDTLRVSITGDPVWEVKAAYEILRSLGIREYGLNIISCPMCGRTEIDILEIVKKIKQDFDSVKTPIKIAVMGCAVNGPGEAKEADLGIAGGKSSGVIFKEGKILKVLNENTLYEEFSKLLKETITLKEVKSS